MNYKVSITALILLGTSPLFCPAKPKKKKVRSKQTTASPTTPKAVTHPLQVSYSSIVSGEKSTPVSGNQTPDTDSGFNGFDIFADHTTTYENITANSAPYTITTDDEILSDISVLSYPSDDDSSVEHRYPTPVPSKIEAMETIVEIDTDMADPDLAAAQIVIDEADKVLGGSTENHEEKLEKSRSRVEAILAKRKSAIDQRHLQRLMEGDSAVNASLMKAFLKGKQDKAKRRRDYALNAKKPSAKIQTPRSKIDPEREAQEEARLATIGPRIKRKESLRLDLYDCNAALEKRIRRPQTPTDKEIKEAQSIINNARKAKKAPCKSSLSQLPPAALRPSNLVLACGVLGVTQASKEALAEQLALLLGKDVAPEDAEQLFAQHIRDNRVSEDYTLAEKLACDALGIETASLEALTKEISRRLGTTIDPKEAAATTLRLRDAYLQAESFTLPSKPGKGASEDNVSEYYQALTTMRKETRALKDTATTEERAALETKRQPLLDTIFAYEEEHNLPSTKSWGTTLGGYVSALW